MCYFTLCLLFAAVALAQQYRATWVSTYETAIKSPSSAVTLLQKLKEVGITHVYVSVWWQGRLFARSSSYTAFCGATEADYFGNMITAAEQVGGIKINGWFEYGNMISYGTPSHPFSVKAQSSGWVLGEYRGWYWASPSGGFGPVLTNMMGDVHDNYRSSVAYGGVQLDDHFGVPTKFGGGYGSSVTALLRAISQRVGANYLSLSPNVMPNSVNEYQADWPAWMNAYLAYEVIPQTYTASSYNFAGAGGKLGSQFGYYGQRSKMVAGIRCEGTGEPTTWSGVKAMMDATTSSGAKGWSIWHSGCITSRYRPQFLQALGSSVPTADGGNTGGSSTSGNTGGVATDTSGFVIVPGKGRCQASAGPGYCDDVNMCPGQVFPWSRTATNVDNGCSTFPTGVSCCVVRSQATGNDNNSNVPVVPSVPTPPAFVIPAGKRSCRAVTGQGYCAPVTNCPGGQIFKWTRTTTLVDAGCRDEPVGVSCCAPKSANGAAFLEDDGVVLDTGSEGVQSNDWIIAVAVSASVVGVLCCTIVVACIVCALMRRNRGRNDFDGGGVTVVNPSYKA